MRQATASLWAWVRRSGLYLAGGVAIAILFVNLNAGPGVTVLDEAEAEGPQFTDPGTLNLVSHVRRSRVCPSQTQRWVWRWVDYRGGRAQQLVPLTGTDMPFLAADGPVILSIPADRIPDAQHGAWFFRSVTAEQCSFLPGWLSGLFGPRVFRSPDLPVVFPARADAPPDRIAGARP